MSFRITILIPDLRSGGAERVNLDLALEFARYGHSVELVLLRAEGELLPEAQAAFSIVDLDIARFRQVPRALARYLRQSRPEVLLVAMWPLTVLAAAGRLVSGHKCSLVVSEHNTLSTQYRPRGLFHYLAMRASMAMGYRLADAVIGVSSGVARDLSHLACIRVGKIEVIHNPIRPRPMPSPQTLAQVNALWSVPSGARILSVGSLKKQKNHALLLRAFARLDVDARLMLLGGGEEEVALRALAEDLGIADRVIFAGFHPDPTAYYLTADLFVLSSDYEGFGNVIVEALACGKPVVSTNCPSGPAEILMDGKFGTLVPVGDDRALAEAISRALSTDYDPEGLRARAREFAPEIAARKYLHVLQAE